MGGVPFIGPPTIHEQVSCCDKSDWQPLLLETAQHSLSGIWHAQTDDSPGMAGDAPKAGVMQSDRVMCTRFCYEEEIG